MSWTTTTRTAAEELGHPDYKNSSTGYEPNDHFITEAYVEFTQESVTEQHHRSDAPSCVPKTSGKPVVCCDASHEQGQEIQRRNSESEQIRTLLDRQRGQILADCQAEIRKHEFQADYDRRSMQKLSETIESQQEELHRAQAEGLHRQDHQLVHEQLLKQNWDLREAHEQSLNEMKELKRFQGSTFDTDCKKTLGRRSRCYP